MAKNSKFEARNSKQYRNSPPHADPLKAENVQNSKRECFLAFSTCFVHWDLFRNSIFGFRIWVAGRARIGDNLMGVI